MALENAPWGGQGACCVGVSDVVDGSLGSESVLHVFDSLLDQVKTDRFRENSVNSCDDPLLDRCGLLHAGLLSCLIPDQYLRVQNQLKPNRKF
jgi:hypothetical protein